VSWLDFQQKYQTPHRRHSDGMQMSALRCWQKRRYQKRATDLGHVSYATA
jgi:hypothetical protein